VGHQLLVDPTRGKRVDTLQVMMTLELVAEQPNWMRSLQVALTRPPGAPERRAGQDPWARPRTSRPRRISDDLSWLRAAMDEPRAHGLHEIGGTAAVGAWQASEDEELRERFQRLDQRGVLDAAGFIFR
jgi:hypothetical protein